MPRIESDGRSFAGSPAEVDAFWAALGILQWLVGLDESELSVDADAYPTPTISAWGYTIQVGNDAGQIDGVLNVWHHDRLVWGMGGDDSAILLKATDDASGVTKRLRSERVLLDPSDLVSEGRLRHLAALVGLEY